MIKTGQQSSVQELQTMLRQKSESTEALHPPVTEAEKERLTVARQSIRARQMLSINIAV
jgi:RNA:NAD 2'-phosphotransferase (TPT1/KptA family)